ncbi:membrane protein [Streptomyces sp. NRRL WC-3753]|nr:membrane protein [Streptomyces sp. NRRL WC-3753]
MCQDGAEQAFGGNGFDGATASRGSTGGANGMDRGGRTGHRAAPGAVVAVGVVGALAVAALALRPAEGLLHSGRGPLGQWGIVAIGASAAWTAGVWTAVRRLRPRFGAERMDLPPVEERLREAAAPLLLSATAVVGVLALVLHRFSTGDGTPGPPPPLATEPVPEPTFATPPPQERPPGSGDHSSLPLRLVLVVLAAVVVVLVVVAVVRRLRRYRLSLPYRPGPVRSTAPQDDDARLLLSAVHSGRRALAGTDDDARAAVIACYAAMEDALAASGVRRQASDSPADLLTRAADAGFAPGPAGPRLTALFREARYSSHPMDGSHRAAAAAALEEIASLLGDRAPDPVRDGEVER